MSEEVPVSESVDEFAVLPPKKRKVRDGRSLKKAKDGRVANSGTIGSPDRPAVGDPYRSRTPKPVEGVGFVRDLRHCLVNPAYLDRSPGEKMARRLFVQKPDRFMSELARLEGEERASKAELVVAGPDFGHDAAMRILDRLLAKATEASREQAVVGPVE